MNKKGFTLVELLAVIVLIGAIMTMAVLGIVNIINNNEEKVLKQQKDEIVQAAINYYNDQDEVITKGSCKNVELSTLKDQGYFEDVKNRCTNITLQVCRNNQDELYVNNINNVKCE